MNIMISGKKYKYHELDVMEDLVVKIKPYKGHWFLISYLSGGDVYRSPKGATFHEAINHLNDWLNNNIKHD